MIVMKFGGTSVESTDAIERVARIVSSRLKRSPVVVVSAMAKVTDQLVAMGNQAAAGDCGSAICRPRGSCWAANAVPASLRGWKAIFLSWKTFYED